MLVSTAIVCLKDMVVESPGRATDALFLFFHVLLSFSFYIKRRYIKHIPRRVLSHIFVTYACEKYVSILVLPVIHSALVMFFGRDNTVSSV